MTLLMYKANFYRIQTEMRGRFLRLVESMDDSACREFLRKYAVEA